MKMDKIWILSLTVLLVTGLLTGCSDEHTAGNGTLSLSMTDAPTDADNVAGVYITITGVEYRQAGGNWESFEAFEGPVTLNLLELTEGRTAFLGDFSVEAGAYNGLRFKLDAAVNGGNINNEATYIEFTDGSRQPLYVPSGTQSGYKALGSFVVPVNGSVFITADFDVRKSVVHAGTSGKYLLKPTIRLVVEDQAGTIRGSLQQTSSDTSYIVYAYEGDTWSEQEAAEPAESEARFPNAVSSAQVQEDGSFVLPFLSAGSYTIVVAAYTGDNFEEVQYVSDEPVTVTSLEETTIEINL